MSKATRATKALDAAGVSYVLHPYDYRADADAKDCKPRRRWACSRTRC